MIEIVKIKREFNFSIGTEDFKLKDPNPSWSNKDVLNYFSILHPELTNSSIIDKGIDDDINLVEFSMILGTKG